MVTRKAGRSQGAVDPPMFILVSSAKLSQSFSISAVLKLAFHSLSWELPVRCRKVGATNVLGIARNIPWGQNCPGRTTVFGGSELLVSEVGRWMGEGGDGGEVGGA